MSVSYDRDMVVVVYVAAVLCVYVSTAFRTLLPTLPYIDRIRNRDVMDVYLRLKVVIS